MSKLINGQQIASNILVACKAKVLKLKKKGIVPKLAVVLVGNDPGSAVYVKRKAIAAAKVGVNFVLHKFPASISAPSLISKLKKIQQDKKLSALIIQLPLPERLYRPNILNTIKPKLDVDFLTNFSLGSLITNTNILEPPAAGAMLEVARSLKYNFAGKRVAVVGAGALVGRPLALLLLNLGATPLVCNIHTKNLAQICKQANVIMSCVGKKNLIRGKMIKKGALVIDAGFAFEHGRASGDVNIKEALRFAGKVTPTPGGVGPITVAKLLMNAVLSAEK